MVISKSVDLVFEITEFDLCLLDFMVDPAIFKFTGYSRTVLKRCANGLPWTVTARIFCANWHMCPL